MIQMMAYEPLTLLMAVGFYLATGSFHVGDIIRQPHSAVLVMPGFLLGFIFITAIKLRKSPFDLSTSTTPIRRWSRASPPRWPAPPWR